VPSTATPIGVGWASAAAQKRAVKSVVRMIDASVPQGFVEIAL
jgi:hypothetical protein